jgi:hypothetical protein
MRRKDKEIADPNKIEAVLNQAQIIHLAMLDGDRPYIVPLNFGYAENTLYFHCAREGKKIDLINRNNTVCFQTEIDVRVLNADHVPVKIEIDSMTGKQTLPVQPGQGTV